MTNLIRRTLAVAALVAGTVLGAAPTPAQASPAFAPLVQTVQYYGRGPGFEGPRGDYGRPHYDRRGYGRPGYGRHHGHDRFYGRPHHGPRFYR